MNKSIPCTLFLVSLCLFPFSTHSQKAKVWRACHSILANLRLLNHRHEIFILGVPGFPIKKKIISKYDFQECSKDFFWCFEHFLDSVLGCISPNIMLFSGKVNYVVHELFSDLLFWFEFTWYFLKCVSVNLSTA